MKVVIEDEFAGVTCTAFEAVYFDEKFNEALGVELAMGRMLLHFERTGERIVRKVGYEPKRDPNSQAAQAFGNSRASFVEELDYDLRAHRGSWRTIPNMFADRVRNSGILELVEAAGASGASVRRIVRGEVSVSLFGFGKLVERAIVAEIDNNYKKTTIFTKQWLNSVGSAP